MEWSARPVEPGDIASMLRAVLPSPSNSPQTAGRYGRIDRAHLGCAGNLGGLLRLPERGLGVVADGRLFDHGELAERVGGTPRREDHPSTVELLLAAYERWGTAMLDHIDGEYAFVLWDRRRDRLLAARDPFGARPLFYGVWDQRLILASEPKQILTLPGVTAEPDPLIVGEYLFGQFEDLTRTFFRGVRRLEPASCLRADSGGCRVQRYWNPGLKSDTLAKTLPKSQAGLLARFRHELGRSVDRRLSRQRGNLLDLSGGLDSTSIVATSGTLARESAAAFPPIETVSGIYPGLPCDEARYSAAMSRAVPFCGHRVYPLQEEILDDLLDDFWHIDSPFADLQRGLFVATRRLALERGTRNLVTGLGGDELLHEEYYLSDLARNGHFVLLVREAWAGSHNSWNSFPDLLFGGLKRLAGPRLKRLYKCVRRKAWSPPTWSNPDFLAFFKTCPEVPQVPAPGFDSLTQTWALRWLGFPGLAWVIEARRAQAARHGLEFRHPYLDRRLAELVLSIPFERRRPRGQWKMLLRSGLAAELPEEVAQRSRKTIFTSFSNMMMKEIQQNLRERLFLGNRWHSDEFVLAREAQRLFETTVVQQESEWSATDNLWRIATLELWLRNFGRYNEPTGGVRAYGREALELQTKGEAILCQA